MSSNYSLYLKLESIINKKANFTIKVIKSLIINRDGQIQINKTDVQRNVSLFEENQTEERRQTKQTENTYIVYLLIAVFVIFILAIVIAFLLMDIGKKKKKKVRTHQ